MQTGMINSTAAAPLNNGTATKTPSNTIDKNGFLQLLVAQLKNQDPTSGGNDPNQMVQQLTSYSSLEQQQQTNTLLSGIQNQNTALFQAQAASMVGKKVEVDGSGFNLQSGQSSMNLYLNAAANVKLTVKDASGNTVAELPQGNLSAGKSLVSWDGKDLSGNPLPDGSYKVSIAATGQDGKAVAFQTSLIMKVDSVAFSSTGKISLISGTSTFSMENILGISI
jgi:flagellar basal-body rod modification protein FlgD